MVVVMAVFANLLPPPIGDKRVFKLIFRGEDGASGELMRGVWMTRWSILGDFIILVV